MRTLLTAEEEQRRSRDRRLSMPVLPARSISTPLLSTSEAAKNMALGDSKQVMSSVVRLDEDIQLQDEDDNFDEPDFIGKMEGDASSSFVSPVSDTSFGHRSARSSQDGWLSRSVQDLKVHEDYRAPVWVPDSRAERCMRCREPFAMWRRRHHCRLCGDVLCYACSAKVRADRPYDFLTILLISTCSDLRSLQRLIKARRVQVARVTCATKLVSASTRRQRSRYVHFRSCPLPPRRDPVPFRLSSRRQCRPSTSCPQRMAKLQVRRNRASSQPLVTKRVSAFRRLERVSSCCGACWHVPLE